MTCSFNGSFSSCVCLINENCHLAVSSTALPPSPSSSFAFSLPHALMLFSTPPILQHYTVAVALLNPRDPQPPAPRTTPTLPSHEEMLRWALKSQSRYGSCFQNAFHSEKKKGHVLEMLLQTWTPSVHLCLLSTESRSNNVNGETERSKSERESDIRWEILEGETEVFWLTEAVMGGGNNT